MRDERVGLNSQKHNLLLIEDACEALGAEFQGRKVGTFGNAAAFGFYPNKQMTMGEGGIITTNNANWAEKLESLRNQGRREMGTWLCHDRLGFNYRLDEMSAALGLSQLSRIDRSLERRANIAATYGKLLRDIPGVTLLSPAERTTRLSWFVSSSVWTKTLIGTPSYTGFEPTAFRPEPISRRYICSHIFKSDLATARETFR